VDRRGHFLWKKVVDAICGKMRDGKPQRRGGVYKECRNQGSEEGGKLKTGK
jgi:hypothetical protein